MKYSIYCAHIKDNDIFRLTCNPSVDLAYYSRLYGINCIEILAQDLDISYADYIIRNIDKYNWVIRKILMGVRRKSKVLKIQSLKSAMARLRLRPLKRSMMIDYTYELPKEESLGFVQDILKGRILSLLQIIQALNKKDIILKERIEDILQTLYLMGRIQVLPSVEIKKYQKTCICTICQEEIPCEKAKCPVCGYYLHKDEPLFACCHYELKRGQALVKFKEYEGFSAPQYRGSLELCTFLNSGSCECLLWMVPGSENTHIISRAVRDVIARGGRCAIAVSCPSEGDEYYRNIKDTFSNINCEYCEGTGTGGNGDIVITGVEDIKGYYKAYDLVIVSETSECPKKFAYCLEVQIKRALKDGGKIIYVTSTPDYKLYKRVLKGEISLVAVPLRNHGRLCPEPRIMTYKSLSYHNLFIPSEVVEYIGWSAAIGVKVHIIVPYTELIAQFRELLLNCDHIENKWLQGEKQLIQVTALLYGHINIQEEENIIVFFADEARIMDEKTLIGLAGMSGRFNNNNSGEVLFIGAEESVEMYNAKHMIRFINKTAWEMGYLK